MAAWSGGGLALKEMGLGSKEGSWGMSVRVGVLFFGMVELVVLRGGWKV